ncbi:MAG TPA: fumarylacetoacetate hydrolase family protein [Bacteroidia bacterium]|nr:fumarylacetoacetate hydrolase family protein [Bacteroidia bacterium]
MKIICIGRNYSDHAKEMNSLVPEEPVIFMKPDTALLKDNAPFFYPEFTKDLHHEVEVVLKISKVGKHIEEKFAHRYYNEIGLGIDFTARDLQAECKKKGLPWEKAKAFDHSAPIGEFVSIDALKDKNAIDFHLHLNGAMVQRGNTRDLIFSFDQLVSYISKFVTLRMGDLIYTGTPAGVGAVKIGDRLEGFMEGKKIFGFEVK